MSLHTLENEGSTGYGARLNKYPLELFILKLQGREDVTNCINFPPLELQK